MRTPTCVAVVVALTLSAAGVGPTAAAAATVQRVHATERIGTAAALSRELGRPPAEVDTVVLARADDHADALAGAPLAAALSAPLLLTDSQRLSPASAEEIGRLGVTTAVLLGGTAALSGGVAADLADVGVERVDRIGGRDRFETARRIAARSEARTAYVVQGAGERGWPDAVAVSALSALEVVPILLVAGDHVPDATARALLDGDIGHVTVVGGPAVVSAAVAASLADPDGDGTDELEVDRLAGTNRYDTSTVLAERAVAVGARSSDVWLATGRNWPDGLTAGATVGALGAVLLLVDGDRAVGSPDTWAWIAGRRSGIARLGLVGGERALGWHIPLIGERVLATGAIPAPRPFDAQRAVGFAAALADEVGPRPGGSTAERTAAERLVAAWDRAGWTVTTEPFALPQGGSSRNVVAWLGSEDPRPGRHVVIGGHIDTVAGSPGANDNASGVGALVAAAEELADEPSPVPLVLVGFGAEEFQPSQPRQHHIGSAAYAAVHAGSTVAMVSVDMIATGAPTCICWYRDGSALGAQRLAAVRAATGLTGFAVEAAGDNSDHGPFAQRGVPAALLSTLADSRYHTPGDTSAYLETHTVRRSGDLVLAWVRSLSLADTDGLRPAP